MARKKHTPKKDRFAIFHRDGFTCQYCGRKPPQVVLEIDHVLPIAEGGTNESSNLITACFDCNRGKGARRLDCPPATISQMLEQRALIAEQIEAYNDFLLAERAKQEKYLDEFSRHWQSLLTNRRRKQKWPRDRCKSLRIFLERLPPVEIVDAIDTAFYRRPPAKDASDEGEVWRYFCGVCWCKIKEWGGAK